MGSSIAVIRRTGLGNLFLLAPVLRTMASYGDEVILATRPEWAPAMAALMPEIQVGVGTPPGAIDLDAMTVEGHSDQHRTDHFGELLGVPGPYSDRPLEVPQDWSHPFGFFSDMVIFAPETAHPARQWPAAHACKLGEMLYQPGIALVGFNPDPPIPSSADFRNKFELEDLIGLISLARVVVAMDSAVLHIAAALGIPTLAIFGGVDPKLRIRPQQKVLALSANMECVPCNKNEICKDRFDCLAAISAEQVAAHLDQAAAITERAIVRLPPAGPKS